MSYKHGKRLSGLALKHLTPSVELNKYHKIMFAAQTRNLIGWGLILILTINWQRGNVRILAMENFQN